MLCLSSTPSATRIIRSGTIPRPQRTSSTTGSTLARPGDCKGGGRPGGEGRAYGNLGNAYQSPGDFSEAIEHHTQDLEIPKAMDARGGEVKACRKLGNAYYSLEDYSKAIEHHTQDLTIAKEVGDKRGRAGRTGTSATRISRRGILARPSSTTRRTLRS
jgi:tetratricopeptide (TPR) repeat protein